MQIEKIVFCSNLVKDNCLIIESSHIKIMNREEGIRLLSSYIRETGKSLHQLEENKQVLYLKKEEFKKLINTNISFSKNQPEIPHVKHTGIKKVIFSCYLIGMILSGIKMNKNVVKNNETQFTWEVEKEEFSDIYQLLQSKNINPLKRKMFYHIWDYLREYPLKSKNGFPNFDEVKAEYLMYNDFSKEELQNLFLKGEIDFSKIEEEYQDSIITDMLLTNDIATSTFKEGLIRNKKGYQFYKKYEDIIIDMNREEDLEKRAIDICYFYDEIKKDFLKKDKIKSYMLSIEPFIRNLEKAQESNLSKKESKKLDQLFNQKKKEKIKKYKKNQDSLKKTTEEVSFLQYQKLAKIQLKKKVKRKVLTKKRK